MEATLFQRVLGIYYNNFLALFVLLAAKPLYYLIVLGSVYDGGFANYGEVVNWYRWLDYANLRDIDISIVQRNDLNYSLQALVYPFPHTTRHQKFGLMRSWGIKM